MKMFESMINIQNICESSLIFLILILSLIKFLK